MENKEMVIQNPRELMRQSTDVAGVCREIVMKTAMEIQGRKYVRVEGWQSIASAHGCCVRIREVEMIEDGCRAMADLVRISDGVVISSSEGFVGKDEPTWYGGMSLVWDKELRRKVEKELPKRPDYAIRAMAQTRATSRVCRGAFAHVVVLIDNNLSTTPAEEVPDGGFEKDITPPKKPPYQDENFDTNFEAWVDAVRAEKRTQEEIIHMIESKNSLTDEQKRKIRSIK